eukprot:SAG31_NODE_2393_length_5793_cov_18.326484_4_plen_91_part_00
MARGANSIGDANRREFVGGETVGKLFVCSVCSHYTLKREEHFFSKSDLHYNLHLVVSTFPLTTLDQLLVSLILASIILPTLQNVEFTIEL